jgi:hypothetical protein
MPRDGALTLSDMRDPFLPLVCKPCGGTPMFPV